MGAIVIVGGQFGSEGKGKVSAWLAAERGINAVVRVGGTNSGHSVYKDGKKYMFRQLPAACILGNIDCFIPAGAYINKKVLFKEMAMVEGLNNNYFIDNNAFVVTDEDMEYEKDLKEYIGSTGSGTGAALVRRIIRRDNYSLAGNDPELSSKYTYDVSCLLRHYNKDYIIEGTQGFGLSLLHSRFYPFVTARDTTAAGFISEVGISPFDVSEIFMVLRTFPIRVGGNSGELPYETTWEVVSENAGRNVEEYTSVTNRLRRVGFIDYEVIRSAILHNKPTSIVLNHLDYVSNQRRFVTELEDGINADINYIGFDPYTVQKRRVI
jgi:adenylosuccinate synthase